MAGRVRRLIEVNHTGANVGFEVAFEWGAATWDWCEMARPYKNCKRRIVSLRKGKRYAAYIARGIAFVRRKPYAYHSFSVARAIQMSEWQA
jgi:hypothetical protein